MGPFISVGIFLLYLSVVSSQAPWLQPYFVDLKTPGVEFGDFTSLQTIKMVEELPIPIRLAGLSFRGFAPKPEIGSFQLGTSNSLNASVERGPTGWFVQINSRQDYENQVQQRYDFSVMVGTRSVSIFLLLENIFDEKPSITYDGPCTAEELQADFNTKCIFRINDPDGLTGNNLRLEIEGKNGEPDYFDFRDPRAIDAYQMDYTLYVKKELHYEQRVLYSFRTYVYDVANNSGSVATIVEVKDMPNLDPVWVTPFATATFDEKTRQTFQVRAVDGDTGIDKPIWYKLFFNENDYSELISINQTNGTLDVKPIDRDTLNQEVFTFNIYAYKYDNESWGIQSKAVFIVDDINDHLPVVEISPTSISFREETYLTVPLIKFAVNDLDLGIHATYTVTLSQNGLVSYSEAFDIIPNNGYKEANFKLTVVNAPFLDYENSSWREFELIITAQEINFPENRTQLTLPIELINWNDEVPIFEKDVYTVSLLETVGAGYIITTVQATDADIDDDVSHEIVGGLRDIGITKDGVLSTIADDVFDYERQTQIVIQIKATDSLRTEPGDKLNSAFAQLTINVIDVNDETPEMRMPRTSPNVTENSKGDVLITSTILATDPDTKADLHFDIIWEDSYATKSGQYASKESYENCFIIEAHAENINTVYGHLKVNPAFTRDIDYETYEVIYLTIRATDRNQEVNPDSVDGSITIQINDVNDNAPEFIQNTLETNRSVVEEALPSTLAGTILAHDIDGPGYNNISYSIRPKVNTVPPTPDGLIIIDPITGALKVQGVIDCDQPKIYYLEYTVTISDGELSSSGDIKISIIDINNKKPYVLDFKNPIELYENSTTGVVVGRINATDFDRDAPHNVLQYMINYAQFPDLRKYFEINVTSGLIQVKLQGDSVLDRDSGLVQHEIHVIIEDNYQANGRSNENKTSLTLILLDVNDQVPELPRSHEFNPIAHENTQKGSPIGPQLIAVDRDEENTPNSWISYRIYDIEPAESKTDEDTNNDWDDLFTIEGDDKVYGQLMANKFLKGYHGTWMVTIEAYDHGDVGPSQISLSSRETYNVTVTPDNFNAPKIIYPTNKEVIRLRYEGQPIGRPLLLTDMTTLPSFEAEDPDGGVYGNVSFEISSYNSQSGDAEYFEIFKETTKKSRLQLTKNIKPKFYHLNVRAVDGGFKTSEEVSNLVLVFVDMKGEPVFDDHNFTTDFTENELGLTEERIIPNAHDPKNEGTEDPEDMYPIYYFIDLNYQPEDAKLFILNKQTRALRLQTLLDREEIDTHWIRIIATNQKDNPEQYPKENSMLLVKITVNDVNDNPPVFEERVYSAGITPTDYINKPILKVQATDRDLNDTISYVFDPDSIITSGENIENVKKNMFSLDNETGVVSLIMVPRNNMRGYFQFNIKALDEVKHSDECNIKIFIVADRNRVSFVFLSSYSTVDNNILFLIKTFEEYYGYDKCNIDDYTDISNKNGSTARDSGITNVRAHFIHNNEAIEASEVRMKSNDLNFIAKLKNALHQKSLILEDVPTEKTEDDSENAEALTTILIVVSIVLVVLCVVLIVAFVMKTRKLNRQMKAFSAPDFGSTSSNLNRREAPTTNVFSVEGSNPVLNNSELSKDAFDTMSVESYESDFVGINNDPTFMSKEPEESKNVALEEEYENDYNAFRASRFKRNGRIDEYDKYNKY